MTSHVGFDFGNHNSVLRSDPSIPPAERSTLLARLKKKDVVNQGTKVTTEVRILRRGEAARRLSCSVRTIDRLARTGALGRRKLPGRVRGAGFLASEVEALVLVAPENGG